MELEQTGNIAISRSFCYALLALAAVLLLAASHGAPQAPHWLLSGELFHLPQIQLSLVLLRNQLHNTWLFLWVFGGLWAIVTLWGVVERRRLGVSLRGAALRWFLAISVATLAAAVVYGLLTNGPLSRQIPSAVPVADLAGLLFALSLPALTAQRIQSESEAEIELAQDEPDMAIPGGGWARPQSFLGLEPASADEVAIERVSAPTAELPQTQPEKDEQPRRFTIPAPAAATVEAMNRLIESAEMAPPPRTLAPAEPVTAAEPAQAASSSGSFREFLRLLNESWAGIEHSGEEIEAWFDQQKSHALARLETPPGARGHIAAPPSAEFLAERLDKVDEEWARLRQVALELARWFERGPRLGA